MKYSKADQQQNNFFVAHYRDRFTQLNGLVISNAEGAWQFLLAVNGGGAVAVLAFIGSVQALQKQVWPFTVLALFVLGLLLIACGRGFMFHHMSKLLTLWDEGFAKFLKDEIDWNSLIEADRTAAKRGDIPPWVMAYASLAMFLVGLCSFCICFYLYRV